MALVYMMCIANVTVLRTRDSELDTFIAGMLDTDIFGILLGDRPSLGVILWYASHVRADTYKAGTHYCHHSLHILPRR